MASAVMSRDIERESWDMEEWEVRLEVTNIRSNVTLKIVGAWGKRSAIVHSHRIQNVSSIVR